MKKLFLILMLFTGIFTFAQEVNAPNQLNTVWGFIQTLVLPTVIAQVLVLLADAGKYIKAGEFSFAVFFTTKLKPFLITHLLSVVLIALYVFVPYFTTIFTSFTGVELTMSSVGLYATVTALVDGFLKKKSI